MHRDGGGPLGRSSPTGTRTLTGELFPIGSATLEWIDWFNHRRLFDDQDLVHAGVECLGQVREDVPPLVDSATPSAASSAWIRGTP